MHELGIVFSIITNVEDIAKKNKAEHVRSVTLEIGEVSTIVNSYLEDCWNWAVSKSEIMLKCKLIIEPIAALNFCEQCHREYSALEHGKTCPFCQSPHTHLLQGTEVNIKEICVY